jgi:hypothetical protein
VEASEAAAPPAFFFFAVLSVCCRVFTYHRAAKGVSWVERVSGRLAIAGGDKRFVRSGGGRWWSGRWYRRRRRPARSPPRSTCSNLKQPGRNQHAVHQIALSYSERLSKTEIFTLLVCYCLSGGARRGRPAEASTAAPRWAAGARRAEPGGGDGGKRRSNWLPLAEDGRRMCSAIFHISLSLEGLEEENQGVSSIWGRWDILLSRLCRDIQSLLSHGTWVVFHLVHIFRFFAVHIFIT